MLRLSGLASRDSHRRPSRLGAFVRPAWAILLGSALLFGCATMGMRSAVSMKVTRDPKAPRDALVYIDEQYIGTLGFVAQRGVRVPEGEHRVTVEKTGYYPFDAIVVSDRDNILLDVKMLALPD
ncbi:MAG TPA: PEGA domain-containing protein [Polyangiaceae bacterium]|nr:PEGA domain-containing protein [Polyangiaceae bacterium]